MYASLTFLKFKTVSLSIVNNKGNKKKKNKTWMNFYMK